MIIVLLAFCLSLLAAVGLLRVRAQAAAENAAAVTEAYRPGVVLVGLRRDAGGPAKIQGLQPLFSAHSTLSAGSLDLYALAVPPGQEVATISLLRRHSEVAFAELDYLAQAAELPNDPYLDRQWSLVQIGLPAAWSVTTGTTDMIVAVVDSGIALGHADLAGKVWRNPGEIPANGLDDDLNGKVDDVNGWHFFQQWTPSGYVPLGNADVTDEFGHGTHVAGIIGAETNNGNGIAGISWGAQVMPVRVLDQYGNGWYSDIAAGIIYAADNGAKIINLSLGGARASETLCEAAKYAFEQRGALVIAATGNIGGAVWYPAVCSDALAVAATDRADQWADFSNHGAQVDIAAPGVEIYSTWPWLDGYFTKSGTSMAAPHVSGVAALVWSRWPEWSNDAVLTRLIETAADVGSPGWDEYTGWGRLDAAAALDASPLPIPTATPSITPTVTGSPTEISTETPTGTPTSTITPAWTPTATASQTPTATVTLTPSRGAPGGRRVYLPLVLVAP